MIPNRSGWVLLGWWYEEDFRVAGDDAEPDFFEWVPGENGVRGATYILDREGQKGRKIFWTDKVNVPMVTAFEYVKREARSS